MTAMLLTEHHLEFLSLIGGYTRLSESTLVKMLHCWKPRHDSIRIVRIYIWANAQEIGTYSSTDLESFVRAGPT